MLQAPFWGHVRDALGARQDDSGEPKFELSLDELGREGYELTWVFMDQKLHGEKDGHVLIFKRAVVA